MDGNDDPGFLHHIRRSIPGNGSLFRLTINDFRAFCDRGFPIRHNNRDLLDDPGHLLFGERKRELDSRSHECNRMI